MFDNTLLRSKYTSSHISISNPDSSQALQNHLSNLLVWISLWVIPQPLEIQHIPQVNSSSPESILSLLLCFLYSFMASAFSLTPTLQHMEVSFTSPHLYSSYPTFCCLLSVPPPLFKSVPHNLLLRLLQWCFNLLSWLQLLIVPHVCTQGDSPILTWIALHHRETPWHVILGQL